VCAITLNNAKNSPTFKEFTSLKIFPRISLVSSGILKFLKKANTSSNRITLVPRLTTMSLYHLRYVLASSAVNWSARRDRGTERSSLVSTVSLLAKSLRLLLTEPNCDTGRAREALDELGVKPNETGGGGAELSAARTFSQSNPAPDIFSL
jgi:hypothetical protein